MHEISTRHPRGLRAQACQSSLEWQRPDTKRAGRYSEMHNFRDNRVPINALLAMARTVRIWSSRSFNERTIWHGKSNAICRRCERQTATKVVGASRVEGPGLPKAVWNGSARTRRGQAGTAKCTTLEIIEYP